MRLNTVLTRDLCIDKGRPVHAVTSLAGEIFLLRDKERDQVEVYDVIAYRLQRCLTVPNARALNDMASCEHCRCVYISDPIGECVHRLDAPGVVTRWTVNDKPNGLSVNTSHNVIVTCCIVRKIKEFSSRGVVLRELTLPDDVSYPRHAIQTRSGQFIVCHGHRDDPVHRVCMMSADGHHIVRSNGGQRGSDTRQYNLPFRLAVDDNEFVFVADVNNRRVTLLSPTLEYVRQVVSRDQLSGSPRNLYLDTERRFLYAAVNEQTGGWREGRVAVFGV